MFAFTIYIFLIFHGQCLQVSENNVIDWIPHAIGYQMAFPAQKKAETIKSVNYEIKSPSGIPYTVKCEVYKNEEPKVDIFNKDGVLIDTVILASLETDPCDESLLKNYISPQDSEDTGIMKIIYLWASKTPSCVERTYSSAVITFLSLVHKDSYPRVACPAPITEFIKRFSGGNKPGGIVSVGPVGRNHVLDFNANVKTPGTPTTLVFQEKDLKGKAFKLICREDILESEDPETRENKITTGSIVNEDNEEIVLEKFKMRNCNLNNININRRIFNNVDRFKIVFKAVDNKCYEREYEYFGVEYLYYFNRVTLLRLWPKKVKCPKKFVGDININAWRPFYKMLFRKHAYSVEIKYP